MKTALFLGIALTAALPISAQYSAGTLTRRIAPQTGRAAPAQPAQPGAPGAPAQGAPVDPAKVQAQKAATEKNLVEFQKKRAEAGSDSAQYELGLRYLTGKGVEKNEGVAREWLEKSAKAGNLQATKKLQELGPAKPAVEVKAVKTQTQK